MLRISLLLVAALALAELAGCSLNLSSANSGAANVQYRNVSADSAVNTAKAYGSQAQTQSTPESEKASPGVCGEPKIAGKVLVKTQTFPIDFKPFAGNCFVTFASKDDMLDEKDVPRGSTFHILSGDKKVFDFPDAFGGQSACWIEGVSFNDLNADGLTDVIVAGKCLGAKDSYPSNAVYVNDGKGFTTNDKANTKIEELKTLKEIEAFVKKNQGLFF